MAAVTPAEAGVTGSDHPLTPLTNITWDHYLGSLLGIITWDHYLGRIRPVLFGPAGSVPNGFFPGGFSEASCLPAGVASVLVAGDEKLIIDLLLEFGHVGDDGDQF